MNIVSGIYLLPELVKALGLEGRPIQKVVIEVDFEGVPRVYIRELVEKKYAVKLLGVVEKMVGTDIKVSDDATVVVTPQKCPSCYGSGRSVLDCRDICPICNGMCQPSKK